MSTQNEMERLRDQRDEALTALGVCEHIIGHNSCTDGKTPNGFVVALELARTTLRNAKGNQ
jgi:hypothetical protein